MGLDVYLYKYENKAETQRKEALYEEFTKKMWEGKDYKLTPESEKEDIRVREHAFAETLGLDKYGCDETTKRQIEIDSSIDKDHYFKIGYFRSSYNSGGIERILNNLGVDGLYEIFQPNDEYCFQPDWQDALKRVNKSIKSLEKKGGYRAFEVSENIFGQNLIRSQKEAINIVIDELSRNDVNGFGAYSNNKGEFFLKEPLQVIALIPGITTVLGQRPCTYVVTKEDNEWYLTALKIVRETIEFVLQQPEIEKYWLHWSS